ncbi:hypothetical protein [Epilithonimonas xixisoli]|uniref:Uncharacterized protein n=1 Tax=Epilithonimonas xixisoli TaxID=1476462 RepID=A0A4R8IF12_9FLAO|nr:hypothetical protein [Epilithonimonas xixisoli]TDX84004.1 hypothetical protein B0I22_1592 [Epilithonimonas xixisoli]
MKLRARIQESVEVDGKTIVVQFVKDPKKQDFEVKCEFNAYLEGIRKWEIWDLKIRWESEIFTDPKTQKKSYFTHLVCSEAKPQMEFGSGK